MRATQIGLTDAPLASGRPNDRVGDRKTEASAVALVGRPVKAMEELGAIFGRDPRPAVIDHQAYSATGLLLRSVRCLPIRRIGRRCPPALP